MTITQTSISTLLELQEAIKAEALRINNMLSDEEHGYCPSWCGVIPEALDMTITGQYVVLTYEDAYEDTRQVWAVHTDYIGLPDEEILAITHEEWDNLTQANRDREIACLKRQADMFGYELKEKE